MIHESIQVNKQNAQKIMRSLDKPAHDTVFGNAFFARMVAYHDFPYLAALSDHDRGKKPVQSAPQANPFHIFFVKGPQGTADIVNIIFSG